MSAATLEALPRAQQQRHFSQFGEWESVQREPSAHLRPFVSRLEGYVEHATTFASCMELPSAIVPLIINFGAHYVVAGPGNVDGSVRVGSFVAGLAERHVFVESTGLGNGMQVNFTPIGAHLFLGVLMHKLTGHTVAFDDVFAPADRRIVAQLEDTPDWDTRFDLVEAFISNRISRARMPAREVAGVWQRLLDTNGGASIGALAGEIGWSRKHLIERFREQIGLPPKQMARILRFQRAIRQIGGVDDPRWSHVAYDSGYYDQAHFNRDFREFTGCTPTEYLSRRLPGGGLVGDLRTAGAGNIRTRL